MTFEDTLIQFTFLHHSPLPPPPELPYNWPLLDPFDLFFASYPHMPFNSPINCHATSFSAVIHISPSFVPSSRCIGCIESTFFSPVSLLLYPDYYCLAFSLFRLSSFNVISYFGRFFFSLRLFIVYKRA